MTLQYIANGLAMGALYGLIGLGFGLIYRTTRIFHFAHGAVFTCGGYLLWVTQSKTSLPVAVSLAVAGAALCGLLVYACIYRPLSKRGAPLPAYIIASLGAYVLIENLIAAAFGNDARAVQAMAGTVRIGGVVLVGMQAWQIAAFAVFGLGAMAFLRWTAAGKVLRAMASNPGLAASLGISPARVHTGVFLAGSALAGLAGALSALDIGADPHTGMQLFLFALVGVILGGADRFQGALLGGPILGVAEALVSAHLPGKWAQTAVFFGLLLLLAFRPQGFLAARGERRYQ